MGIVNLDEVDTINQLIPLSKIPLSDFHCINIFAHYSIQPTLCFICHSQYLELCCFFRTYFLKRIQIIPPLISTSKLPNHPDILGIRKFLESGIYGNPEILGIRKFSKQGILKQERIAERVSARVELLPGLKFTSEMVNKMKYIGKMVNKMKLTIKIGK